MSKLQLVEESDGLLVFRMGIMSMLGQFAFCIFAVAVATFSLTLFLRTYLGALAYILIGGPGIICIVLGFIGCLNAKKHTFVFDNHVGQFTAMAGGAELARPLRQVTLVHIERECTGSSGGGGYALGGGPNTFAVTLLFSDGSRYRLEGGASVSGSEPTPPEHLRIEAERIRAFLRLPQPRVALLDITRASQQRKMDEHQAHVWLSKYLSCRMLEPALEPPLPEYDWVEPPEGVEVPHIGATGVTFRMPVVSPQGVVQAQPYAATPQQAQSLPRAQAHYHPRGQAASVVIGRPVQQQQQQPRVLTIVLQEGQVGVPSIRVVAPDGTEVQAQLPPGMRAGQTLTIQY